MKNPQAVVDLLVRPRRSRDTTSSRPRAASRAQARMFGYHSKADKYVAEGGTLLTQSVRWAHDAARDRRVRDAQDALALTKADLDEALCALHATTLSMSPWLLRSVDAHEYACQIRHAKADAELQAAERSASRPIGDLVMPPRVSLPQPRAWPNASPGGTSQRRALTVRRSWVGTARAVSVGGQQSGVREQMLQFGRAVLVVGEA